MNAAKARRMFEETETISVYSEREQSVQAGLQASYIVLALHYQYGRPDGSQRIYDYVWRLSEN